MKKIRGQNGTNANSRYTAMARKALLLLLLLNPNEAEEDNQLVNRQKMTMLPSQTEREMAVIKGNFHASGLGNGINVLLLQTDQQRWDMIGGIQDMLPHYKGKTKIKTPNLDKLMKRGTTFTRHYVQSPSCGPSRGVMRTGCTLERTGLLTNSLAKKEYHRRNELIEEKVNDLVGFDQILASRGYNCEVYGKWHLPDQLKYVKGSKTERAVGFDSYDYRTGEHMISENPGAHVNHNLYRPCLEVDAKKLRKSPRYGEQINSASQYPYKTIQLDSRYGKAPGASVSGQTYQMGRDSLGKTHTTTHCQAIPIPSAMERLAKAGKPWFLDVSYKGPHAPYVATGHYFDPLYNVRHNFFIPPNNNIKHLQNSPYKPSGEGLRDPEKLKEFMAAYYALIEEVDTYVGDQLDMLDKLGQTNNTLVIFTSDHGEHLGAHGKIDKGTFYEETMLAPMILSLPGIIPEDKTVDTPTTTLDLHATIADYTGNSDLDNSDGQSLRRFVEDTNMNEEYDHEVVVAEHEHRNPNADGTMPPLKHFPHLMVVKGDFKLMIHKSVNMNSIDVLINLKDDPFEMNNLIGKNGYKANDEVIGKVEHLKALAVEWMERMDGPKKYFSDPKYNGGVGKGYIAEVNGRRKWKALNMWISDSSVQLGKPVLNCEYYQRNEYIYLGRSTKGTLTVTNIKIVGKDAHLFELGDFTGGVIKSGEFRRVKITFKSNNLKVNDARVLISHNAGQDKSIKLIGYGGEESQITVYGCEGQDESNGPVDGGKDEPNEPVDGGKDEPNIPIDEGKDDTDQPVGDGDTGEQDQPIEDLSNANCIEMDPYQYNTYGNIRFLPGDFICRGNKKFGLTTKGRVVYMVGPTVVWEPSNSKAPKAKRIIMSPSGQLMAIGNKSMIWSSNWKSGSERLKKRVKNSKLHMTYNGVEIRSPENVATWRIEG